MRMSTAMDRGPPTGVVAQANTAFEREGHPELVAFVQSARFKGAKAGYYFGREVRGVG